jgi:multiple sugar transport system substrate-binding protein
VIPVSPGRSSQRTADAVEFIKGLLNNSLTWSGGGHVPAWLPVQRSKAFLNEKPQSNYIQAAFNAVYDPPAWYTGAGSDFQNSMGSVISSVQAGQLTPKAGVNAMTASLETYSKTRPPV